MNRLEQAIIEALTLHETHLVTHLLGKVMDAMMDFDANDPDQMELWSALSTVAEYAETSTYLHEDAS